VDKGSQPASFFSNFSTFAKGLGVVGGLSGVLTGFAFVIGYIATKSFDEMLGIPTSTTLDETYIRTGLMFVPNTAHHISAFISSLNTGLFITLIGLALIIALSVLFQLWPFDRAHTEKIRLLLIVGVHLLLLYGLLSYLPQHVAPNHPYNKRVAFMNPPAASESTIDQLGKDVNDALRQPRGNSSVSAMYGKYAAATFLCLLLIPAWAGWDKRLRSETDSLAAGSDSQKNDASHRTCLQAATKIVKYGGLLPLTIAAAVMIFTLPASYGAMVLNGGTICGEIKYWPNKGSEHSGIPRDTKAGYLLSDISNPQEPVIFLERVDDDDEACDDECEKALQRGPVFKILQFDRDEEIHFIRLWRCSQEIVIGSSD
jgi:hypothetical protein